jgi:hypothetical protein
MGSFPYEGIKFGVYDALKKIAPRDEHGKLSEIWKLSIGAAAGTAAGVVMFPNDTVRRRLQLQVQHDIYDAFDYIIYAVLFANK